MGQKKKLVQKNFKCEKILGPKKILGLKNILDLNKILGRKFFWIEMIIGPNRKKSVLDVPRNLPLKYGQNQVNNSFCGKATAFVVLWYAMSFSGQSQLCYVRLS